MSDAAPKEEKAGGEQKQQKQKAANPALAKKREKSSWTIERCMKAARRFSNVADWQAGAPSSYKAASAKGWESQCTVHMSQKVKPAMKQKNGKKTA